MVSILKPTLRHEIRNKEFQSVFMQKKIVPRSNGSSKNSCRLREIESKAGRATRRLEKATPFVFEHFLSVQESGSADISRTHKASAT